MKRLSKLEAASRREPIFSTRQRTKKGQLAVDFDNPNDSFFNKLGTPSPTALEMQVAPGDSGGPWLTETFGGWSIAGVTSGARLDGSGLDMYHYGGKSIGVPVANYLDWLNSTGAEFTVVPEPATVVYLALGCAALGSMHYWRRRLI